MMVIGQKDLTFCNMGSQPLTNYEYKVACHVWAKLCVCVCVRVCGTLMKAKTGKSVAQTVETFCVCCWGLFNNIVHTLSARLHCSVREQTSEGWTWSIGLIGWDGCIINWYQFNSIFYLNILCNCECIELVANKLKYVWKQEGDN